MNHQSTATRRSDLRRVRGSTSVRLLLFIAGWFGGILATAAAAGAAAASPPAEEAEQPVSAEAEALLLAEQWRVEQARRAAEDALAAPVPPDPIEATARWEAARDALPLNPATAALRARLQEQIVAVSLEAARRHLANGDVAAARAALERQVQARGPSRASRRLARQVQEAEEALRPGQPPPAGKRADADVARPAEVLRQIRAGELDAAAQRLASVDASTAGDPEWSRVRAALREAQHRAAAGFRIDSREALLLEVDEGWRRAAAIDDRPAEALRANRGASPLAEKLAAIKIPSVSFHAVELSRVAATLSELSTEFDPTAGEEPKGVNLVVIDPGEQDPTVSLTLRNLSLKRILDFITDSVGYRYEIESDAVVIRPGGEVSALDTEFFAVTRSTVIRMTGVPAAAAAPAASPDPFAPVAASPPVAGVGAESEAIRRFLQQAGVNFEGTPGASLAYDGSAMIVTQTPRNLERIRNILNRYNDVRQVEIEAKFMEVQEGALEELGVNWSVMHGRNGDPRYQAQADTRNRTLADGFTHTVSGQPGRIVNPGRETEVIRNPDGTIFEVVPGQNAIDQPIVNQAATLPGGTDLALQSGPLAVVTGAIGELDVEATIRALSRQAGTDLLSAPKVTVLSGHPATITVAQEMRYPQSYGEIQSQVGSARSESSSAGVTITAGTPQDFATRNIGVELRVTPTVEEDDYSISLDLNPKVTEFEGFVEYGGQSVAISGGTTVTVPSGFFQPVFSTREVSTRVTLWDGATLIMGGLTREEVKQVSDKVPILGDIPLLGRAFRSKGESSQKRNLLIFVTANLVSPGGSPKQQALRGVSPSGVFQQPSLVTPAGVRPRTR